MGPLFLPQGTAGIVSALVRVPLRTPILALVGALPLTATAARPVLSVWVGLFGYHDRLAAPYAGQTLGVAMAGVTVLIGAAGQQVRIASRVHERSGTPTLRARPGTVDVGARPLPSAERAPSNEYPSRRLPVPHEGHTPVG
jgi:hypothetical protein